MIAMPLNVVFLLICAAQPVAAHAGAGASLARLSASHPHLQQRVHEHLAFLAPTDDAAGVNVNELMPALGENETTGTGSFLGKPPRIFRNGDEGRDRKQRKRTGESEFECGVTHQATSSSDKHAYCPKECPYHAQDRTDDLFCTFHCVTGEQCKTNNKNKPIPDDKTGTCRAPMVNFCKEYQLDGSETCKVCQRFYYRNEYGMCQYQFMDLVYVLGIVLVIAVIIIIVWVVDIACLRGVSNPDGLKTGTDNFSRQQLHMPLDAQGKRHVWSLRTNLLTDARVAGPGVMLHFNFQAMVILWAFLVAGGWALMAVLVDKDLFRLGTRSFGTPRENCILVAWGFETQQRLMWTKILFLLVTYLMTFFLCIAHGIRQLRIFQKVDSKTKTMKDFAAMLHNIPPLEGTERFEDALKKVVQDGTGQKVEGVSICWDSQGHYDMVMKECRKALEVKEKKSPTAPPKSDTTEPEMNFIRRKVYQFEKDWMGPEIEDDEEESKEEGGEKKKDIKTILKEMKSSECAFVVFETEAARDKAIAESKKVGGFEYKGNKVYLEARTCEPATVQWQNFDNSSNMQKTGRVLWGFGGIFAGLTLWTVVFYAPYAWSIFNFNYENGQEPGAIYGISFSLIVTIGNVIMYEICAQVSDRVGFRFKDDREACYMVLYTIACTFNILMDLVTTYFTAAYIIEGLGFRTYDGTRIEKLDTFYDRFESYAMQRSLAENTYTYAYPSTYLIPFLLEPIMTIFLPWRIGVLITRTHPEIVGRYAEQMVTLAAYELGRYADILLDVLLGILIFYFPGGYTARLFMMLGFCHIYIYVFDHWKVLRAIPACTFATQGVDYWSQLMLAPLTGLILSCLVFKANCQGYGYCLEGHYLFVVCTICGVAHTVVHVLVVNLVVPLFGKEEAGEEDEEGTFKFVGSKVAANWFNANPVHCLRSQLVYGDSVPCMYLLDGKEHLLEIDKSHGCHFKSDPAPVDLPEDQGWGALKKRISESFI